MNNYILDELMASARSVLEKAKTKGLLNNSDVVGDLREALIRDLLEPWLPPYMKCVSGVILDGNETTSSKPGQVDVIIYDSSVVPSILVERKGVVLFNGAIARIEVKSTLNQEEVEKFVLRCKQNLTLKWKVSDIHGRCLFDSPSRVPPFAPMNMLFAYGSAFGSKDPDSDYRKVVEAMQDQGVESCSGLVSTICVPGRGLWKPGRAGSLMTWHKLAREKPEEHLAWFTGVISSTCFIEHVKRQGRNPTESLEGGIGFYLPDGPDTWVPVK